MDWGRTLRLLRQHYSEGKWRVPQLRPVRGDPFRVLISTVLSQRARDEATVRASQRLFERYPDATTLSRASLADIARLTRNVGLSNTKVRAIREVSRQIVERFSGVVPGNIDDLLSLPMVGRKTANCTLVFGFGVPAIPVDRHIHRVSNRLLGTRVDSPDDTERLLTRLVPRRYWAQLNPVLVQHGQNICNALRPRCGVCPVLANCSYGRAHESDRHRSGPRRGSTR